MTFARALHKVLDRYFGDCAFESRDRKQIEKIREGLLDEVFAEVWSEIPEELRLRISDDGKGRIRERIMAKRRPSGGNDATTT